MTKFLRLVLDLRVRLEPTQMGPPDSVLRIQREGVLDDPKKLGMNKHSSLFCSAISDKQKSFITVKLQVNAISLFLFSTNAAVK